MQDSVYCIIKNKEIQGGLKEWDKKERQQQTWYDFKLHLRNVQRQLRRTGDLTIKETINNDEIISMVSANIYNQLNNIMATNNERDKENSDESTQNDQISELTQEVQNMGKALAIIL